MSFLSSLFNPQPRPKPKPPDRIELENLYYSVQRTYAASRFSDEEKAKVYRLELFFRFEEKIPLGLRAEFYGPYSWLLMLEENIFDLPALSDNLTLKEQVDLKEALRRKQHFFSNEGEVIATLEAGMELIFTHIGEQLPQVLEGSPFVIPLVFALPNPKKLISDIIGELWQDKYRETMLFVNVTRQLNFNLCEVSGIKDPFDPDRVYTLPTKSKAPLMDIVDSYLKRTPFEDLLKVSLPLKVTYEDRFTHMHIVGGSGAGKTQLLQNLILHDLEADEPPGMVIVDSQGDLIEKLSHLALFDDRLAGKLIIISPKDIEYPPAINIFDVNRARFNSYNAGVREQITAGVIETFDYLFRGLLGADLTAKQGIFFRYVARLMLAVPETMDRNATILDLIDLMVDPEPYQAAIETLPPIQKQFFLRDFPTKPGQRGTFDQTKEQIRYRLQGILENPTLYRLFTSPETKIDIFDELNKGSVILVDTAKDFLKGSSAHFGRIFIALTLQAVLERAAIPENQRRAAFLFVDEASEYFDDNIDDLLTEARKYKLGCCFARQYLEQCTGPLRASFATNTGIKMAAGVSTSDARSLAPDMRTTHDFILDQPKLHFACHIRNVTPQAVSIPIEAGKLERRPRLSDDAYERMRSVIRERVSLPPQPEPKPEPRPEPPREEERPDVVVRLEPRTKRKRPKKRHEPLVGDIDTSA